MWTGYTRGTRPAFPKLGVAIHRWIAKGILVGREKLWKVLIALINFTGYLVGDLVVTRAWKFFEKKIKLNFYFNSEVSLLQSI